MSPVRICLVIAAFLVPAAALAAGGHDAVGCSGCHSLHAAKGQLIFAVAPNKTDVNPTTKQPYTGTTALCLACHQDKDKGGQGFSPVSRHVSHPFGLATVNPKVASVPQQLLREGGRFECIGCHDPHPSNPNYSYLRADVGAKGQSMDVFCAVCHALKADPTAEKPVLFTSMDETAARAPSAAKAAAEKPASSKAK